MEIQDNPISILRDCDAKNKLLQLEKWKNMILQEFQKIIYKISFKHTFDERVSNSKKLVISCYWHQLERAKKNFAKISLNLEKLSSHTIPIWVSNSIWAFAKLKIKSFRLEISE